MFAIVSQVSLLLPIIAGWVYYRKLTSPFRVLFYFFLLCIGFEIQAAATRIIYNNNMPGLHLFSVVQFLVFSTVYYQHFSAQIVLRRLIFINAVIAFIIALADALFIDGIMNSNTLSRSYAAVSMVVYTLIYLYQLFQQEPIHNNRYDSMFWFTIAVLIYFGNNWLYFMLRRYLLANAREIETLSYYLYLSLNIIAHFLYAQSFRCFREWKTES
jgi:hypothetical protein